MLEEYEKKRDFSATPEPKAKGKKRQQKSLLFCVQKHSARNLHYDLRLEAGGVLKSWAVPQGPSLDPDIRRLAIQVEDHPLDYVNFEGVIPEHQYGAGEVIVWDQGEYYPTKDGKPAEDRQEAEEIIQDYIDRGKVSVFLKGQKLKGTFALAHMKDRKWLLIKQKDEFTRKEADVLEQEQSVISGLTIEGLRQSGQASSQSRDLAKISGARKGNMPDRIKPMLAMLAEQPFSDEEWFFEPKMDGIRVVTLIKDKKVKLLSRRQNDITSQYPAIVKQLEEMGLWQAIIDGEICALDEKGRPSFQKLQPRINLSKREDILGVDKQIPAYYFIFDLIYYDRYDLRQVKLKDRKEFLGDVIAQSKQIRLLDYFQDEGELSYKEAIKHGLEGVIAKKADSHYEPGARSHQWLKIKKITSDDFVIAGYTRGKGGRAKTFGALLLGYYDDSGQLVYAGHVGTGFDDTNQAALKEQLDKMRSDECPFTEEPSVNEPATWVEPKLVAEVKFTQWTRDGHLRSPVFSGLRPDKPPEDTHTSVEISDAKSETGVKTASMIIEDILGQLNNSDDSLDLKVEGETSALSNLNKEFWPATDENRALTKRDLLVYLSRVSSYLLPHLRDRPLTLNRYPDGIQGKHFFQKQWSDPLPDYVQTVRLSYEHAENSIYYIMCNNLATLLWLGQMANIELHTWFSRMSPDPDMTLDSGVEEGNNYLAQYPDFIIFDIDPYIYSGKEESRDEPQLNRAAFDKTRDVALWLKEKLDKLSLASFVKTSGKTGLHVYVPVLRQFDYDTVRTAARTVGGFLYREHDDIVTLEWEVEKRRGKIFLDFNQNVKGKTLAAPYSPRPVPQACISTPVRWKDLDEAYPTNYTLPNTVEQLHKGGDPWAGILDAKSDLAGLLEEKEG